MPDSSRTSTPILSDRRANVALAVLFLGTFVLGTAETIVVGMLNLIARDLEVSAATAGRLVTAYALGLSIGGPLLAAATIRGGRRTVLWLSLAIWLAANVLAVVGTSFDAFLLARLLMGSLHGLFVGVAFTIGTRIVPPERVGRAISTIVGGFAVSTALGVPGGTLIGEAMGWRAAFAAIVVFGVAVVIATLLVIPPVPHLQAGSIGAQLRYALAPRVLATLGLAIMLFAGQYAALTYITPFLEEVTGISGGLTSAFLLAYGGATAVGAFGGGRFANEHASRALVVATVLLVASLAVLALVGPVPLLVAGVLVLWGVVGIGLVPSLQYRVVTLAGPGGHLAVTLPASAINAGIASGALIGGWTMTNHGAAAPILLGAAICLGTLPIAWATGRLSIPVIDEPESPRTPVNALECAT